ncbi:MAG: heme exporter protein CcmD [Holosporales bacterium]|nr:heme exporter protein CcmD [Holosporales bacterium]
MFNNSYAYYIGSAYAIALLSCCAFFVITHLQTRATRKRVKRLEKNFKNNDL